MHHKYLYHSDIGLSLKLVKLPTVADVTRVCIFNLEVARRYSFQFSMLRTTHLHQIRKIFELEHKFNVTLLV